MISEKAAELGRLIGQSEEYKAVQRARDDLDAAKELREKMEQLEGLAGSFQQLAQQGQSPTMEQTAEYERLLSEVQADSRYQQLVAAEANFDKQMLRVNQHIMEGIDQGATSRIITLG